MMKFKHEDQIQNYEIALLEYVEKYGLSERAKVALSRDPSVIGNEDLEEPIGVVLSTVKTA